MITEAVISRNHPDYAETQKLLPAAFVRSTHPCNLEEKCWKLAAFAFHAFKLRQKYLEQQLNVQIIHLCCIFSAELQQLEWLSTH